MMSVTYRDVLKMKNIKPLRGLYDIPQITLSYTQGYSL
jgi:hypothetical protein